VLEDLGLVSALTALANDFAQASDVPVTRKLDQRLPELTRDSELVVYRIAQEGLTNVARHADASHVELSLTRQPDGVLLRIADDGHGIDGAAIEGAGIRGMRERAILIGAGLQIAARAGGGTDVRLLVPS
jgi:two-component system, NarL family, sensor histidine kinase UhpB